MSHSLLSNSIPDNSSSETIACYAERRRLAWEATTDSERSETVATRPRRIGIGGFKVTVINHQNYQLQMIRHLLAIAYHFRHYLVIVPLVLLDLCEATLTMVADKTLSYLTDLVYINFDTIINIEGSSHVIH